MTRVVVCSDETKKSSGAVASVAPDGKKEAKKTKKEKQPRPAAPALSDEEARGTHQHRSHRPWCLTCVLWRDAAAVNKFLGWVNSTVLWDEKYARFGGGELADDNLWGPLNEAFAQCTKIESDF